MHHPLGLGFEFCGLVINVKALNTLLLVITLLRELINNLKCIVIGGLGFDFKHCIINVNHLTISVGEMFKLHESCKFDQQFQEMPHPLCIAFMFCWSMINVNRKMSMSRRSRKYMSHTSFTISSEAFYKNNRNLVNCSSSCTLFTSNS